MSYGHLHHRNTNINGGGGGGGGATSGHPEQAVGEPQL